MVEFGGNLISKQPSSSTRADSPSLDVFGVGPHQITESSLMGNLLSSSNYTDLIDRPDFRTETSVYTKNFAINDGSKHEKVEYVAASLPNRGIAVFLLAFFVKTVHLGNLARLVVSTDKHYPIGIPGQLVSSNIEEK